MVHVDELEPEVAARVRQRVRALLSDYPEWTERELAQVILHARDVACAHPTFVRALGEGDMQSIRQAIEADPDALDAVRVAALAPMLLEVAREQ